MAKRKFRTKQADLSGKAWTGFRFGQFIEDDPASEDLFSDPIIEQKCGPEIDYGKLFAYCFRRFGYPNRGWDDYKELVSYYLTTPCPDLVLKIAPYVGDTASLSLGFLAAGELPFQVNDYARRDRVAWEKRSLDWAETQGLPEWMPRWIDTYNTEFRPSEAPPVSDWREACGFQFAMGKEGTPIHAMTGRVAEFRSKLHLDYSQIEAWPAYYERPCDLSSGNDDDPLKSLAFAALEALEDLKTPVGVRDQAINAFGLVEVDTCPIATAKPAASAGYPSGQMGNFAAKEFAELHSLVLELGGGDAKRGIKKALATLRAA